MKNKEIEELAKRLQEFVIEKCDLVEHPTSRNKVLTNNRAKTIAEMLVNERKPEPQQEKLCPPFLQPVCTPEMAERSGANKIMKQEKELLPCPFCGGEARLDVGDYYNIGCANSNCLMFTVNKVRSCRDKDECIKSWNTRPSKCGLDEQLVRNVLLNCARSHNALGDETFADVIENLNVNHLLKAICDSLKGKNA